MSTTYSIFILFLFTLVSAANIALGYWAAVLLRGGQGAIAGAGKETKSLSLSWLRIPSLPKFAKKKTVEVAQVKTEIVQVVAEPATGPAPLEGTSLACLKLSEVMATFCQSVYEQDLLLREFLENPGDSERATQLADGAPKFFERHLKRFNQAAAKLDAISKTEPDWLEGKQAVKSALASLLADANQARDEFKRGIEHGQAVNEALAKCMRGNVDRALTMRGQLERGIELLLGSDPGFARLPVEALEEKGKHLLGRAWIGARCATSFEKANKFFIASLDLVDFRAFNHEHGYAVGAVILDGLDKMLSENVKAGEWCFRIDGDRWYFLLTTGDLDKASARVDHIRQQINATRFDWAKKEFSVQARAALTSAKSGEKFDRLELALRESILVARRQNEPLMHADGSDQKPLKHTDAKIAPVTISL